MPHYPDPEYIGTLMSLKSAIIDGIRGFVHGMWFHRMKQAYEFEVAALEKEVAFGRPLTGRELDAIRVDLKHEKDMRRWERQQRMSLAPEEVQRRNKIEHESWNKMGGRPSL